MIKYGWKRLILVPSRALSRFVSYVFFFLCFILSSSTLQITFTVASPNFPLPFHI